MDCSAHDVPSQDSASGCWYSWKVGAPRAGIDPAASQKSGLMQETPFN
jgi:hypothetical protein